MVEKQDTLYANPLENMVDFRFDDRVADVFPDMIQRSVPGYGTLISTIGVMAAHYAQAESIVYDLGCSLGAVTLSMRQRIQQPCSIIAVDNSPAMIKRAQKIIALDNHPIPVAFQLADIQQCAIQNASVVVMNFTLQFIPIADRLALLKQIYMGLKPGGVLILSEKLAFEDPQTQQFQSDIHHDFKRTNGYSDLEVSQKRSALENVLIAETLATHQTRLKAAGFERVEPWFQCFNFASMVAFK